jgi:hypothetical protein
MKLDPGMHIGLHLVLFEKSGVTPAPWRIAGAQGLWCDGSETTAMSSFVPGQGSRPWVGMVGIDTSSKLLRSITDEISGDFEVIRNTTSHRYAYKPE